MWLINQTIYLKILEQLQLLLQNLLWNRILKESALAYQIRSELIQQEAKQRLLLLTSQCPKVNLDVIMKIPRDISWLIRQRIYRFILKMTRYALLMWMCLMRQKKQKLICRSIRLMERVQMPTRQVKQHRSMLIRSYGILGIIRERLMWQEALLEEL